MTPRILHSRYSVSAVATIMSTIRSTPTHRRRRQADTHRVRAVLELWRVTRGDVRVGVVAFMTSAEGRNPRCTGIPAVQKPIID